MTSAQHDLITELQAARRKAHIHMWRHRARRETLRTRIAMRRAFNVSPAKRLAELLTIAERAPFYAQRLGPSTLDPHERLRSVPTTQKADLQRAFADIIPRSADGSLMRSATLVARTSGSTGATASHLKNHDDERLWSSAIFDSLLGDYGVAKSGEMLDLGLSRFEQPFLDVLSLPPRCYLSWHFSGFFADRPSPLMEDGLTTRDYAEAILRVARPDYIWAMPSKATELAKLVRQLGITLRPTVVLSSYEQLLPSVRALLEETFNCPVKNVYGTSEIGYCAWECASGNLHFARNLSIVETVDAAGTTVAPGETGRIVVTPLVLRVMPLLRYDTGDRGKMLPHPCDCGSTDPALERLGGRETDVLYTSALSPKTPYVVMEIMDDLRLPDYQIVQQQVGALTIITSNSEGLSAGAVAAAADRVSGYFGEPVALEFDDERPFILAPSGKRNPIVQMLAPSAGQGAVS